ncbi:MAG TPA: phage tail protein [Methanosarcinaceae archaeon]|nr:phage tail protein [Methanosarcinaceae archaeon]HJH31612.1 phage tail protein [Methanosarcinaceae archaeon]
MSLLDMVGNMATDSKINGVVIGIVTNNKDPEGIGRIRVKFPWLSDEDESNWARVASLMAGKDRGIFILPEIDDEVLVVFEHGDINVPYVIGSLWNGKDVPPEINTDGKNNIRMMKSRSGHVIRIDDTDGNEKIEIVDKTEKNMITIDTENNKISIISNKDIEMSAPNGKITIDAMDIEIKSSTATKIEASAGMDLKASGNVNVKGATINLN